MAFICDCMYEHTGHPVGKLVSLYQIGGQYDMLLGACEGLDFNDNRRVISL